MSSQSTDDLTKLAGELESIAKAMETAVTSAQTAHEVVDDSGQITVFLNERGRVDNVRLGANWKDHVPAEALGPVLTYLLLRPQLDALDQALDAGLSAGPTSPGPAPRVPEIPESKQLEVLIEANELRRETNAVLEQIAREGSAGEVEDEGPQGTAHHSKNHHVAAYELEGRIATIEIDAEWAEKAPLQALSDALMEATDEVYQAIDAGEVTRPNTNSETRRAAHAIAERGQKLAQIAAEYQETR